MNNLLLYLEGGQISPNARRLIWDALKTFPDEKQMWFKLNTLEFNYKEYEMNNFNDRLQTFKGVNKYYTHDEYAKAGFYVDKDYNLICFACQSILYNLPNKRIDPYNLHILFIEKCNWMEQLLGKQYIDNARIFYATQYEWLYDNYYDINEDATISPTLLQSIPIHCKLYIEAHPQLIDYMDFGSSEKNTDYDCLFFGLKKITYVK